MDAESLEETTRKNKEGRLMIDKYMALYEQFKFAVRQKVNFPNYLNEAMSVKRRRIEEHSERLFKEINAHSHKLERNPARWTEKMFKTEVLLLSMWISLRMKYHIAMAELGVENEGGRRACDAFHNKIIGVVTALESNGMLADRIADTVCDLMGRMH
jgi:hypothetical protein